MSKSRHICDQIVTAIPRCLCGANVGNCIQERCHQVLKENPTAPIRLEQWRKACLLESPHCRDPFSAKEACSIGFDYGTINRHNNMYNKKGHK